MEYSRGRGQLLCIPIRACPYWQNLRQRFVKFVRFLLSSPIGINLLSFFFQLFTIVIQT